MPRSNQFQEKLDQLRDYSADIGDEVISDNEEGILQREIKGESMEFTGFRCKHGEHLIIIGGNPELRYFQIHYFLSVIQNLAVSLPEELSGGLLEEPDSQEARMSLSEELLNDIDRNEMRAYLSSFFLIISGGGFATNLHTNDEGSITDVEVYSKIFPYEEDFSITEYEKTVQSTVSAGSRAGAYLTTSMDIHIDKESLEESRLELDIL